MTINRAPRILFGTESVSSPISLLQREIGINRSKKGSNSEFPKLGLIFAEFKSHSDTVFYNNMHPINKKITKTDAARR
jgi:hypothetical protein